MVKWDITRSRQGATFTNNDTTMCIPRDGGVAITDTPIPKNSKIYAEITINSVNGNLVIGIFDSICGPSDSRYFQYTTTGMNRGYQNFRNSNSGLVKDRTGDIAYPGALPWGGGDTIGLAIDTVANKIAFYKNGISMGVAFDDLYLFDNIYVALSTDANVTVTCNFGANEFKYPIPKEYKPIDTTWYAKRSKTSVEEVMNIGDCMPCRYTAPVSGQVGKFSELGTTTIPWIPPTSSATPDGSFNWIYVGRDYLGRKKFIADRNIQHSISWDALNSAGICSEVDTRMYRTRNFISINGYMNGPSERSGTVNFFNQRGILSKMVFENYSSTLYTNVKGTLYITDKSNKIKSMNPIILSNSATDTHNIIADNLNIQVEAGDGYILVAPVQLAASGICTANSGYGWGISTLNIGDITPTSSCQPSVLDCTIIADNLKNYNFSIRLLTGGISQDDKDNEWNKIIGESTLNGLITAGDNSVWNWDGVSSWCSTSGGASTRATRGKYTYSGTIYDSFTFSKVFNASSGIVSCLGFRPVLLVETLSIDKFLIRQNPHYYSLKPEYYDVVSHNYTPLVLKGGDKPNKEDVDLFGFDDINSLIKLNTNEADNFVPLDKFNSPEIIAYII